jgi:CelD/BcsL family acetyltransferase involved in cellulose biosynthesis
MKTRVLPAPSVREPSQPRSFITHAAPPVLLPRQPAVVVIRTVAAARPFVVAWDALAREALEPNAFHEPWTLLPAIEAFGLGEGMELLFVCADVEPARSRLIGVFPLRRQHRYGGLPVQVLGQMQHNYCYLGTPLVHREHARECLGLLFDWLRSPEGAPLLELSRIAADGPFHQTITDVINERGYASLVRSCHTRALFRPRADASSYINEALRVKRRKEFQRLEKRLGEVGELRYDELTPDGDPRVWTREFLALEASGWKGEARTAFASNVSDRSYLERLTAEAFLRGRLMMLALRLDGRPIAMKYNLLAGDGSFAFKIAYDEGYARYSPGVLLEIENIRRLHGRDDLEWMDSGARAEHPMINRLWMDRRTIQTVLLSPGLAPGELVVSALPLWRWLRRRVDGFLRARRVPVAAPAPPPSEEM